MADVAIGMVEDAVNAFIDGDLRALSNLDQREELVNDLKRLSPTT